MKFRYKRSKSMSLSEGEIGRGGGRVEQDQRIEDVAKGNEASLIDMSKQ